jgi:hypothetical protein
MAAVSRSLTRAYSSMGAFMIGGYADVHFASFHPTPDKTTRTDLPDCGKHTALDLRNKRGNMYVYAVNI